MVGRAYSIHPAELRVEEPVLYEHCDGWRQDGGVQSSEESNSGTTVYHPQLFIMWDSDITSLSVFVCQTKCSVFRIWKFTPKLFCYLCTGTGYCFVNVGSGHCDHNSKACVMHLIYASVSDNNNNICLNFFHHILWLGPNPNLE
jgi:hypothetical protein